jgi:uncharacterized phage-like protein YoqJ
MGCDFDLTNNVSKHIEKELQSILDEYKPDSIISGMALGADTIWAELAIKNNIELIAAIPFKGQESRWPQKSQDRFNKILNYSKCKHVVVSDGEYSAYKMQIRNVYIVDNSDVMIAVWNGKEHGGTYNCLQYVKTKGKKLIVVDPNKALIN